MTREEAIEYAESKKMRLEALAYNDDCKYGNYAMYSGELSFVNAALTALRPVSREQVEKVWRGCEYCEKHKINLVRIEMNYNDSPGSPKRLNPTRVPKFCPICGRPLTDEALEMVMERLEALFEEGGMTWNG